VHRVFRAKHSTALLLALTFSGVAAGEDIVVVVAADSPSLDLTRQQVADIFLGSTARFPDGRRAIPVELEEGAALRDEFYASFLKRSPAQVKAQWSKIIFTGRGQPPRQLASSEEIRDFVARTPGSIAYLQSSAVDDGLRVVARNDAGTEGMD
jgi:ABC-type phosphate transport system substrate-binding protein